MNGRQQAKWSPVQEKQALFKIICHLAARGFALLSQIIEKAQLFFCSPSQDGIFLSLAGMRRLHSRALYLIKSPAAVWAQKRPLPLYTRTNHSAAAFINANMLFANFIYRPRHRVVRRAVNILPCN